MGKVYRMNRKAVQRIKAREIVPGDIVEVAGELVLVTRPVNVNAGLCQPLLRASLVPFTLSALVPRLSKGECY